jgi:hypothetical protein
MRGGGAVLAAVVLTLVSAPGSARSAGADASAPPHRVPAGIAGPRPEDFAPPQVTTPYHGSLDRLAYGGQGELRFAEDRQAGVSNPEWFSVGRVNGFAFAHLGNRLDAAGQACWDRGSDDFVLERAELGLRIRRSMQAHAGIFLLPLGSTNLSHDAPDYDFAERSLVATQLIGVPNAQLGIGARSMTQAGNASRLSWEADLVTGYDDGIITESPGGTRVPSGRNNYGDKNGIPALAGRVVLHGRSGSELGLAAESGQYNKTEVGGVKVDDARWVHVVVADGSTVFHGFRLFSEAAYAAIDVPPGLRALFAERQCGASVEIVRNLFDPLFRGWRGSCLTAGIRADAVDFDRSIQGDSRSRLSASLNLHSRPLAVTRLGWYYEIRRDRFNNATPLAGLTFTAATYF